MPYFIYVAIGAFFGAIARFWIGKLFNHKTFPYGTLIVNLVGAFLLGLITGMGPHKYIKIMFGTGFMGAFTTFSTFKVEHLELHFKRQWKKLSTYVILTYGVGLCLAWIGFVIGS
ncbi:CrcB protein [Pullulanibacillus pueri]|uniref:Fluoride-specific ion channel FluC n=1 Tax=Pullulanibacillus pueri TaxID=1437324 RepID=A0A8J3EL67_9BACL|nr:fluoride efflux transporter CrcB [Pullulanibacillus pueri]MBM7681180.1 CrcB protein [Pullulanibacillus pueri]GGH77361.1 chromosome condensation protein CrcB [Pullulanibacillus pueri]